MIIIREIIACDWQAILHIQAESYSEIEPESVHVLQSKWLVSTATCIVAEENQQIIAYCLAHPWDKNSAPPLFTALTHCPTATGLFIHDLAISPIARGRGIGRMIFDYLSDYAVKNNIHFFSLVAIQNATHFWKKLGFQPATLNKSLHSYGKNPIYMQLILQA